MPLGVWKDRNFTLLVTTLCLGFYGFSANGFWIALFWQRVEHVTPLFVAIRLIPMMVSYLFSQFLCQPLLVVLLKKFTHSISVGGRTAHQHHCSNDHAQGQQQAANDHWGGCLGHLGHSVQCTE